VDGLHFSVHIKILLRFQPLAAASIKVTVFRAVAIIALIMENARTSETPVNFYQTSWRNNPEESHLQKHSSSINIIHLGIIFTMHILVVSRYD
jgi:hypothetical protein